MNGDGKAKWNGQKHDSVNVALDEILQASSVNKSELSRITGASRVTLNRLLDGHVVRRSKVVQILCAVYHSPDCHHARKIVREELRRLGEDGILRYERHKELQEFVSKLEHLIELADQLVLQGNDALKFDNLERFERKKNALNKSLELVIKKQKVRREFKDRARTPNTTPSNMGANPLRR